MCCLGLHVSVLRAGSVRCELLSVRYATWKNNLPVREMSGGGETVAVWQVMKGEGQTKTQKKQWDCRDLDHQHFTESTGRKNEGRVKEDDLMLIYFPGPANKIFMGLQRASENGPRALDLSVPGAVDWPWGLEVKEHIWVPNRKLGIGLDEAIKNYLPGRPRSFRPGLSPVDGWGSKSSIRALIEEIRKRGEDPLTWKTWPRSL